MEPVLLAALVGVAVGVVVGALGGGGGILTVPVLVYLLGQGPHVAATSSLVIVGTTSLVALLGHARRGHVRWAEGLVFGLLGSVAAYGGASLSLSVDEALLMALFALLLLVVALLMLHRSWLDWHGRGNQAGAEATSRGPEDPPPDDPRATLADTPRGAAQRAAGRRSPWQWLRRRWPRAIRVLLFASVVGLLTGFFGVGGGFAAVPALVLALGFGMRAAVGTSLLVIAVNSAVGLAARLGEGVAVDWPVVAVFTAASSLAGLLGTRFSARARPDVLGAAFGVLLAVVSVVTAAQAFPTLLR